MGQTTTWTSYTPYYDQSIVSGYQKRYDDAMAALNKYGAQQLADLKTTYANAQSSGIQDLVNRGLTGTTIMPSVRLGYAKQLSDATNRLNEQLSNQKLAYQTQLSGDLLNYQANARQQAYANALSRQQLGLGYAQLNANRRSSTPSRYSGFVTDNSYQSPALGTSFYLPIGRLW